MYKRDLNREDALSVAPSTNLWTVRHHSQTAVDCAAQRTAHQQRQPRKRCDGPHGALRCTSTPQRHVADTVPGDAIQRFEFVDPPLESDPPPPKKIRKPRERPSKPTHSSTNISAQFVVPRSVRGGLNSHQDDLGSAAPLSVAVDAPVSISPRVQFSVGSSPTPCGTQ